MNVASSTAIITTTTQAVTDHLFALMQIVFPYVVEVSILFLAYHLIKRLVKGRGVGR